MVMKNRVDWELLRRAGVSDPGIDFLKAMLITESCSRARIGALLQHSWVRATHDAPGVENADQLEELDASQSSLAQDHDGEGLDLYNDMENPRDPKRLRELGVEDENHGLRRPVSRIPNYFFHAITNKSITALWCMSRHHNFISMLTTEPR